MMKVAVKNFCKQKLNYYYYTEDRIQHGSVRLDMYEFQVNTIYVYISNTHTEHTEYVKAPTINK